MFKGLDEFDTRGPSEEGAWLILKNPKTFEPVEIDGTKVRLLVAGPDSVRYKEAMRQMGTQMNRAGALTEDRLPSIEESDKITRECLAKMVIDWQGISGEDGQPMACSSLNVERLFYRVPGFQDQVDKFATVRGNFLKGPVEISSISSSVESAGN